MFQEFAIGALAAWLAAWFTQGIINWFDDRQPQKLRRQRLDRGSAKR